MYVNPNHLENENLPEKQYFNNILTMKDISDKKYDEVKLFYKKMEFKNLREYLECYLTSDITLLADVYNNFRKLIFDQFQIDCLNTYQVCRFHKIVHLSIVNVKLLKMLIYLILLETQ